ncbi:hypothetical protein MNBD_ALPHA04-1493 [hydrothermal vent metagenome]|uniref:NlpC/P60 domain-containing protein n=1 Tax=hydrothermal vent metagenome TaxID=652676 RepID=A0A3B0SIW6_9ZZZZ
MADQARKLCGSGFRLHGRSAEHGFDCIGLASECLSAAGLDVDIPSGYSIRGGDVQEIAKVMELAGFEKLPAHAIPVAGDIVLVKPGPVQLHLMVKVDGGFVHAHASLGKVALSPGPSPWPIVSTYRLREE